MVGHWCRGDVAGHQAFCASINSRRGDCLLYIKTGVDYSPCFGAERVERVLVAKSVLRAVNVVRRVVFCLVLCLSVRSVCVVCLCVSV